jgi:hypothetical protein
MPEPDLTPLLPDDPTVQARRAALVNCVISTDADPRPKPFWRRRRPRLALGSAISLAGVTAAIILSAGGDDSSRAFAVEPQLPIWSGLWKTPGSVHR